MKTYTYINGLGRTKMIVVYEEEMTEEGNYPIALLDVKTGEWCGCNIFTPEKLQEFLNHYGIGDCD